MKILTLSIKQKYFDEILAGTKKVETREIRHTNLDKYARWVYEGKEYTNAEFDNLPEEGTHGMVSVKYDALKLLTGAYSGTRPYILVEVKDIEISRLANEGKFLAYEYELNGETDEFPCLQIDYHLGKILEKHGV